MLMAMRISRRLLLLPAVRGTYHWFLLLPFSPLIAMGVAWHRLEAAVG